MSPTTDTSRKLGNDLLRGPDLCGAPVTVVPSQARWLFFQELVLMTQFTNLRHQFCDLSCLGGFPAILAGGVLLPVPGSPVSHFSMPPDRTRRPPRRSYGPAQGTSRATCPSSFSEYFAAGMVSILSTQGKKNPQSKKHRATQNMGIVDLLARRVSGRCAPELGPLLAVPAIFVTTLKIRTSRPLTGRRARMDSVRVTRR